MNLRIGEDSVVLSIEERIATWTHLPRRCDAMLALRGEIQMKFNYVNYVRIISCTASHLLLPCTYIKWLLSIAKC
jgi:hypothetical protein